MEKEIVIDRLEYIYGELLHLVRDDNLTVKSVNRLRNEVADIIKEVSK